MENIFTIGVYNSSENEFFSKLKNNHIDLFCDIRQRRGVRGSQYKFVNSRYLQSKLNEHGIGYLYLKELAPTNEIRQHQKDMDKVNGETKKQRTSLGKVFRDEYTSKILDSFNMKDFAQNLNESDAKNICFFCVEENPLACHRSIVAQKLAEITDIKVIHL